MAKLNRSIIVAGIDVGGRRKGFHAVALQDCDFYDAFQSADVAAIVDWCRNTQAAVVGVDAPCRWSLDGRARPAERQLMGEGIWCFSTPTCVTAKGHRTNHYGWMLNGEKLFQLLEPTHPLCCTFPFVAGRRACFETFPHAITTALLKSPVSARDKRSMRRRVLETAGIETSKLTNIDFLDAALCALTAHHVATGLPYRHYGDSDTGLIFVPEA